MNTTTLKINRLNNDSLKDNIINSVRINRRTSMFKAISTISIVTILMTLITSFLFPASVIQGFIITPMLLLAQMSLWGYADFKLDSLKDTNDQAAQVYCFIERYYSKLEKDKRETGIKAA